jgi:flagellar hook assembly protein FlgD
MTLQQNYPNPFNSTTTIRYTVAVSGQVKLRVFDLLGRLVATLVEREESAGDRAVEWDGRTINGTVAASGVYFYRMECGNFQNTQKMILLR